MGAEKGQMASSDTVVKFDDVCMLYPLGRGLFRRATDFIHAVDGVSFELKAGETLGLVGESGCGKSTVARLAVRLEEPTSGTIMLRVGDELVDVGRMQKRQNRAFRSSVQLIFQDPYGSLNPRKTVYDTVAEPLVVNKVGNLSERTDRIRQALDEVRLNPIDQYLFAYPHELSGGQRQRVAIARALVLRPNVIIADEPTSMLDIAVRTSIMRLMLDLQQEKGFSYLYITHDMGVARYMSNRIAVMYLGKLVEVGDAETVIGDPAHPYTRALMSAVLGSGMHALDETELKIQGSVSKPVNPPPQCRFLERCLFVTEECRREDHPALDTERGRLVSCFNPQKGKL